MRPFEAQRRVYLVFGAHLLNDEAADALLKDLEEPPEYAVIVLVADEVGPLPETIRSRCQAIPFRRLSERAVREQVLARAPQLSEQEATSIARVASGRLDRAERLLDPASAKRRTALLETARSVYAPEFDAVGRGAQAGRGVARARGRGQGTRGGGARRARPDRPRGRAARQARRARGRARGAARLAGGARVVVPRPRRRRGRSREGARPRRPGRGAARGRDARAARGRRARRGARARDVAPLRGVPALADARPGGALRPASPRLLRRARRLGNFPAGCGQSKT